MNYFEFYGGDYCRDTADLTLIEHGAFLLLLSTYYATEKPLPVGPTSTKPGGFPSGFDPVFRIARAMTDEEKLAVMRVADRFFPIDPSDGLRHNVRADAEIVKARARISSARENGRHGGRPKKPNQNPAGSNPVNPNGTQPLTHEKAPHAPCSKEDLKQNPSVTAEDPKAELFTRWKATPGSGGGAFLVKLLRDHKPEQRVLEAIEATLSESRADVKAYVLGVLAKKLPSDPLEAAAADAARLSKKWDSDPDSAPWAGAL